jgi:hypothetical protein
MLLLTPVRRRYEPGSRSCWFASSTDGEWDYLRRVDTGSWWYTVHRPTWWELASPDTSLRYAQRWTAQTSIYRQMSDEAWGELSLPEHGGHTPDGVLVTNHDRARGVLTWLADNHPHLFQD